MSDPIVAAVQADLGVRSALGQAKYRTTLARTDLSPQQWLQHLYEELLDAACYVKRLSSEFPVAAQGAGIQPGETAAHGCSSQNCAGAVSAVPAASLPGRVFP